jgi:hypothetical protein
MQLLRLFTVLAMLGHVHLSAAGRAVLQAPTAPPPPYETGMFSIPPPPPCPTSLPDQFLEPCDLACGCTGDFTPEIPLFCYYDAEYAGDVCVCFPAASTVVVGSPALRGPERRAISDLRVGDAVQVALNDGSLAFSAVTNIPHSELRGRHLYVQLRTASATLTLSEEHYTYVAPNLTAPFSARVATPGRNVQVGDVVWVATSGGLSLVTETVLGVERVLAEGMFNPYTDQGTIVVDGIAASVYIDFLGNEAAAHRSAAKYRLAARLAPRLVRWLHDRGLNQPLLLFMARALPEMARRAQSGPRYLRPLWRAALWSLTEGPALLESALQPAPAVPLPPAAVLSAKPWDRSGVPLQRTAALPLQSAAIQTAAANATCPAGAHVRANGFDGRPCSPAAFGHRYAQHS